MNYNSDHLLHEPCHRTLKPTKEILIETPKSPELSPNHTPYKAEKYQKSDYGANRLKSPPLSNQLRSLLSPRPTKQQNKILFTIPPRVRCRLFSKKEQKNNKSPIIDKNFAETLKKMNSTNQLDLTIDDSEFNFITSKSSPKSLSSIVESNIYEDNKEIEEITTPPSSQIESTHTSPNTITSTNESPIKYRVYSTISSTINSEDDEDDEEGVFSPLHSLNSSPYPTIISTPPKITKSSNIASFNNNVSPLPINDYDYTNITTTDSPPAVKRTVRIMNNPDIYDDDDFEKRRKLNKHVLSSNVEFELSINTSVYSSQYETVNYPTVSIVQDFLITKSSSFNKFLIGKRGKSILKMYGQNECNRA